MLLKVLARLVSLTVCTIAVTIELEPLLRIPVEITEPGKKDVLVTKNFVFNVGDDFLITIRSFCLEL